MVRLYKVSLPEKPKNPPKWGRLTFFLKFQICMKEKKVGNLRELGKGKWETKAKGKWKKGVKEEWG